MVEFGYLPKILLECPRKLDAQLIVGKRHGVRLNERLLGSVATEVLDKAECDALVVPLR